MLACARLGVIHSEVFGGFSGAACGDRIADSGSRILITSDGYYRNGELIDHKIKADEAVEAAAQQGADVDKELIWRPHPGAGGAIRAGTPLAARWSRAATSSSTRCLRRTAASGSNRCPCRPRRPCSSCTPAVRPDDRRGASTAPAGTWPTSPARRSTTRTST